MPDDRRELGKQMMQRVYGWESGEPVGDFVELTIDHLFGEIWSRETMSIRDRRLVLIGLLVGQGLDDVLELQLDAARRLGELSDDELREIVVFLTYYAGWPRGAKLNAIVEKLTAGGARGVSPREKGS
jgi:4-carboxymuconolactone decarboxylase